MSQGIDAEVVAIQDEFHARQRLRRRWIVVEEPSGRYSVHEHSAEGVAPPSDYPTAQEAGARVLQLMGVTVGVLPQSWPEEHCIGTLLEEDEP